MIEHHFVVVYNRDTGHYYLDEENVSNFPNGSIYDTSLGKYRHIKSEDLSEDNAAWGWLANSLFKLSNETSKV